MNTKRNQYMGILWVIGFNLILLVGLGWLWTASAYSNADFIVNTTADTHDAIPGDGICADSNGACSLRAAIEETNALTTTDVIDLPAGAYLLSEGELLVTDSLTLTGDSPQDTIIDAQSNSRVFHMDDSLTYNQIQVLISGVTVQGGSIFGAYQYGGGMFNTENLILLNSIVKNNYGANGGGIFSGSLGFIIISNTIIMSNTAYTDEPMTYAYGGGIYSAGLITLTNSVVTNNIANSSSLFTFSFGGGIYVSSGPFFLINSLISSNYVGGTGGGILTTQAEVMFEKSYLVENIAGLGCGGLLLGTNTNLVIYQSLINHNITELGSGGGICQGSGQMTITNSTISNNEADSHGGGIFIDGGSVFINNTTIVGNKTFIGDGGGIFNGDAYSFGFVLFRNSLIANNFALGGGASDCGGYNEFTSYDYNLIEDLTGCIISGFTDNNIVGQDPILGSLADNGGNTLTYALLPGSPAIDQGACTDMNGNPVIEDQRGFSRPFGSTCDMGAYEADGNEPTPTPSPPTITPTPTPTASPTLTPTPSPTATLPPSEEKIYLPIIH